MKGIVEERAIKLGEYIVESKDTVRRAAVKFGISKSTVHKDVTKRNGQKPQKMSSSNYILELSPKYKARRLHFLRFLTIPFCYVFMYS